MTMRWVHTLEVAEDTGETKAKARLVVQSVTDPDLTEIRSERPTPAAFRDHPFYSSLRRVVFT